MKICITGGSGILGTSLRFLDGEKIFVDREVQHELLDGHQYYQADIRDKETMLKALSGCNVLIHCAGSMGKQDQWDDSLSQVMEDNLHGLMTVFNAAKDCQVERILFASSNHVVGMYEVESAPRIYEPDHGIVVNEDVPVRPDSFYGVSKTMGESYGRYLAENGGPRCYAMRIGSVRGEEEDHPYAYAEWGVRKGKWSRNSAEYAIQENRLKALWMSRRDFLQMVELLIHFDGDKFEVFNAVSDNDRKWLDITKAKTRLKFEPKDNSEGWVQVMTGWKRDQAGGVPKFDKSTVSLSMDAIVPVLVKPDDDIDLICELIKMTVMSARDCSLIRRILLATNDARLAEKAEQLGVEVPFLRGASEESEETRADEVLRNFLEQIQETGGQIPDLVAPMEITYPFRPPGMLDRLAEKLCSENFNTVIAGYPEKRPVWVKRRNHLVRMDEYEKPRDTREPLHVGLASLGCITYSEVLRKGSRFGGKMGILEIEDPVAAVEIRDFRSPAVFNRLKAAFRV